MLVLGIDAGGTYTDAVIMDRESGFVLEKYKTLTINEALEKSIEAAFFQFDQALLEKVELVSVSTTLATNAIIEEIPLNAGMIFIGKKPKKSFLQKDESLFFEGLYSIKGFLKKPLVEEKVHNDLEKIKGKYEALAISGFASVRNPEHEQKIKKIASEILDIPIVCGHELTGSLGFYERSLTAYFNAGLIPLIEHLILAIEAVMERYHMSAPLMVVKGDGNIIIAQNARKRPVETLLSGPAASICGAAYLTQETDGLVVDIGGTTTDIALLKNNDVKRDPHGASVGGWQTHVESLDINTYALGGDSAIKLNNALAGVNIGPNKIKPYSRMSTKDAVNTETGLTPTDLLHLLKVYDFGDRQQVVDAIMKEFQLKIDEEMALAEDLLNEVIKKLETIIMDSLVEFGVGKETKILGVGAPAAAWMSELNDLMKIETIVPEHAEVANAIGAAVGSVYEANEALVRYDQKRESYLLYSQAKHEEFEDYQAAVESGQYIVQEMSKQAAIEAGAAEVKVDLKSEVILADENHILETKINAVATGAPRYGQRI